MDFKGRNVLITGGGNGIGAATAKKFSGYGANVIITDWDEAAAESVAKEIVDSGGIALGLKLDVTKIEDWKAAAVSIHAAYGKVNVVFNNAYFRIVKPAHLTSVEEWDKQIDVNFGGIHKSVITFIQDLQDTNGAMVNTSSVHAHFGFLGSGVYAATKGGIVSLSNQLALEYGPKVRVNAVLPGPIMTRAWHAATDENFDEAIRGNPMHRMGLPEEVGEAVCFLASDQASYISGASLLVDGGFSAQKESSKN
jgi:NAD(P)-dependent dehydrogenase (short-subunit alcohol dehydrogenase family)